MQIECKKAAHPKQLKTKFNDLNYLWTLWSIFHFPIFFESENQNKSYLE